MVIARAGRMRKVAGCVLLFFVLLAWTVPARADGEAPPPAASEGAGRQYPRAAVRFDTVGILTSRYGFAAELAATARDTVSLYPWTMVSSSGPDTADFMGNLNGGI